MTTPAIEITDVAKSFRSRSGEKIRAVDGISITIGTGEIVALLGPNGAGKTTTLDMILGLNSPTSGTVTVFGRKPRKAVQTGLASAVLQTGGLLADLTVRETLLMIASVYPVSAEVENILQRIGLSEHANRRVSKCSGGERQRLCFGLALLPNPDLLVLDEPTAGMDVAGRQQFWDTMRAEAAHGRTIVFATHYLAEAEQFAARTVLLANGQIVADAPTDELRHQAAGRTVSAELPSQADAITSHLHRQDTVISLHRSGNRTEIVTTSADEVALYLLQHGAKELEITSPSLEAAFLQYTTPTSNPAASALKS